MKHVIDTRCNIKRRGGCRAVLLIQSLSAVFKGIRTNEDGEEGGVECRVCTMICLSVETL